MSTSITSKKDQFFSAPTYTPRNVRALEITKATVNPNGSVDLFFDDHPSVNIDRSESSPFIVGGRFDPSTNRNHVYQDGYLVVSGSGDDCTIERFDKDAFKRMYEFGH